MKPTPLPWRVDLTYPRWPQIVGADGTLVNVDFENAADAFLIVRTVNQAHGFTKEAEHAERLELAYSIARPHLDKAVEAEYVEWWGIPVRLP